MWQIVAFNRTGTRPALNQAVGYVRVAHRVLRGPLGPLSPTAASGWWFWKWQFRLPKWQLVLLVVCFQKHPCFWKLATHCHSGRRPGSRRVKASLYAILNECRLSGLLNPSTNISRRLAISLRPSARLILSKTAPLHWFSKNETLICNCQFFDNLPTVNFIYQNYAQTVSKSLSGFARLGFKKQSSLRIDSDVI